MTRKETKKDDIPSLRTVAILLGGGVGNRFAADVPKQFVRLSGRYVSEYTIDLFENHPLIDDIYLVIHRDYHELMNNIIKRNHYKKIKKLLYAGPTRQESSAAGVFACGDDVGKVIIHETVRPFVTEETISEVINGLDTYSAILTATPHTEAVIKIVDGKVLDVPRRDDLYRGQTPQGFLLPVIKDAHERSKKEGYTSAHCDCELVNKYGSTNHIHHVKGSEYNIKITFPLDIFIADKILQTRSIPTPSSTADIMEEKIRGKVVVIFGGTSGIGLEMARICNEFGGIVYSFSRKNNTDIRNIDDIKSALKTVYKNNNKIDYVVCSAAIVNVCTIEECTIGSVLDQINTNLVGNIFVAKESIPYLKETQGSLVFFASSSYSRGRKEYSVYSATKAAMVNFTQGLSEELEEQNIRVNIVNPDRTDTPMRRKYFKDYKPTLIDPKTVASAALRVMTSDITGSVIDIKKFKNSTTK
jgi:2-C-methyl-D-erythritol 4-phosphate cytidylyltransferase